MRRAPATAQRARILSGALAACASIGCGGTEADGASSVVDPLSGCDGVALEPPEPGGGAQLSIEIQLSPGEEKEWCQLALAGDAWNVNWSEGRWTPGAHHGIVHRTSYRDVLPTEALDGTVVDPSAAAPCLPWAVEGVLARGGSGTSGRTTTELGKGVLPDDVAFKIAAGEVLLLTLHMFNATDHEVRACYKANLHSIAEGQVAAEAGVMSWGNPFITVPASGTSTAEMACPVSQGVTLASATSHMHERGVGYSAVLLEGDPLLGGRELRTLHEGNTWREPSPTVFSPALSLAPGQWIRWSCSYENPEVRNVAQGDQTTDEMCMFSGAYWPRSDAMEYCGGPASRGRAGRPLGHGTKTGADFVTCMTGHEMAEVYGGGPATSDLRYAVQSCVTELCPAVSGRIWESGVDLAAMTCN